MNIIIFSKDRASQLELLLRTFKECFKEFNDQKIKVLYKTTNSNFEKAYSLINYDNVELFQEHNFKQDLIKLFDKNDELSMFLVDDIVFKDPFSIEDREFKLFKNSDDILTLSLRLNPQLNYCYAANIPLSKPTFVSECCINWTHSDSRGDFGYPMSVDGHVFKTKDIFATLQLIHYTNPNTLEAYLAGIAVNRNSIFRQKPKLLMYGKSKLFNNPLNKVQTNNPNRHGDVTAEYINEQFLNNKRIKDTFRGLENKACHQEEKIEFENR